MLIIASIRQCRFCLKLGPLFAQVQFQGGEILFLGGYVSQKKYRWVFSFSVPESQIDRKFTKLPLWRPTDPRKKSTLLKSDSDRGAPKVGGRRGEYHNASLKLKKHRCLGRKESGEGKSGYVGIHARFYKSTSL